MMACRSSGPFASWDSKKIVFRRDDFKSPQEAQDYKDLLKRDKLSLDLFWIKDKSLTDTESLAAPGIIAAEIADDLEAALEQFTKIATRLVKLKEEGAS